MMKTFTYLYNWIDFFFMRMNTFRNLNTAETEPCSFEREKEKEKKRLDLKPDVFIVYTQIDFKM